MLSWNVLAEPLPTLGLGTETIQPLKFPKFMLGGNFTLQKNIMSMQNKDIQKKQKTKFAYDIGIEVGLLKYLNAGYNFSLQTPSFSKMYNNDPMHARLTFSLKPYWALTDRIGLYLKGSMGPSVMFALAGFSNVLVDETDVPIKTAWGETYGNQPYKWGAVGISGGAFVGINFFPISRVGISAEWGARSDILFVGADNSRDILSEMMNRKDFVEPPNFQPPGHMRFLVYDFPVALSLNIIL